MNIKYQPAPCNCHGPEMATYGTVTKMKKKKKSNPEEYPMAVRDGSSDVMIGEVLQNAYLQSKKNEGQKNKKNKDLLESLKKGEGLITSEDNATLLANTYDPDVDPKNAKSNKQRQKQLQQQQQQQTALDNEGFIDDEVVPKKRKEKKQVSNKTVSQSKEVAVISDCASEVEPEGIESQPVKPKRKKKIKKDEQSESQVQSDTVATEDDCKQYETDASQTKTKKKKKKAKKSEETEVVAAYAAALDQVDDNQAVSPRGHDPLEDRGQVLQIIVHRTDRLKSDFRVAHPVVKVHVVDMETGAYLKKQNKDRPVTCRFERENDYILPIMTFPYDFKTKHSTLPIWEEQLIFNENFDYIYQSGSKVMLIFDLVDFVSMNEANKQLNNDSANGGWHRIAWAFIKMIGANNKPNIGKKIRLQLYQPPKRFFNKTGQIEEFCWWSSGEKIPYPSTLYVTIKSIVVQKHMEPSKRSIFPFQDEMCQGVYDEYMTPAGCSADGDDVGARDPSPWTRLAGQPCKIPNLFMRNLPAGKKGCVVLRFSNNGKYLACGCHDVDGYPIFLYEIPNWRLRKKLSGHYKIIYDICWSKNDEEILTASADGTARVWDIDASPSLKKLLPHPSFVYTAKFHVSVNKLVATGGYDRIIRLWSLQTTEPQALLLQELDGHIGNVNSLCFNDDGTMLYSGDSLGCIHVWNICATDIPSSKGLAQPASFQKQIKNCEIQGNAINVILMHPNGRRLLVHTRNNKIQMLDLRVESVMHKYVGILNFRELIHSTITPCGSFIFGGSEDGQVYVWGTETGDQVAIYSDLGYQNPVCDVSFHPLDHIVAFCSHGDSQPVKVYRYDHKTGQKDLMFDFVDPSCQPNLKRPTSPELFSAVQNIEDEMPDQTIMSTINEFAMSNTARVERVKNKLLAVSALSTRSNNFDAFNNQSCLTASRDWRTSSTLGTNRPGSARRTPTSTYGQPQITISKDCAADKAQVTFKGGKFKAKDMIPEVVVALYDYSAQRSDELSLFRGDKITVLYKDNENWWMGEIDGLQGFFPANYVTSFENSQIKDKRTEPGDQKTARSDVQPQTGSQKTHAIVTKSGELKIISAGEESDADLSSISSRQKSKTNRRSTSTRQSVAADIEKPPRSRPGSSRGSDA